MLLVGRRVRGRKKRLKGGKNTIFHATCEFKGIPAAGSTYAAVVEEQSTTEQTKS